MSSFITRIGRAGGKSPAIARWAYHWNYLFSGANPGVEFFDRGEAQLATITSIYGPRMVPLLAAQKWRQFFDECAAMAISLVHGKVFVRHAAETAVETVRGVLNDEGFRFKGENPQQWGENFQKAIQATDATKASHLLHKGFAPPLPNVS